MRFRTQRLWVPLVPVWALLGSIPGCLDDVEIGAFSAGGAGGTRAGGGAGVGTGAFSAGEGGRSGETSGGGAGTSGATGEAGASGACVPVDCFGKVYACGDCEDNDGDGAVDALDPGCLGPCDDSEDSFAGLLPGQNNSSCRRDCYFDRDAGAGNDRCYYDHACDPLSVAPDYPPSGNAGCAYDEDTKVAGTSATCAELRETQSEACLETCMPLVPNGCDCFGCCELPARSGRFVFVGSTVDGQPSCTEETLDDPVACKPCTPVAGCFKACEACDVCAGEVRPGPECRSSERCGGEVPPCGADVPEPCPNGSYCITGCCIFVPR